MLQHNTVDESEIGKRIRDLRQSKKITLSQLAQSTSFSKSYLSRVEKSSKAPPVSTLVRIAGSLGVSVAYLIGETDQNSFKNKISYVKKNERPVIGRDGTQFGYAYESVAHRFPERIMDPFILTIPVKPKRQMIFQHEGEELLFVLEGTMKFYYGDEEFICEEGDCIYFDSNVPHHGVAFENKEVKCFMSICSTKKNY